MFLSLLKIVSFNSHPDSSQMKMTKQAFLTDFINYKFVCVKIAANTNKKTWWGILIEKEN